MAHEVLTVLVDMDGVLADFDAEIETRISGRYAHIPLAETRANFYIADDYPEHTALVRALSREQGFFDALPLVDGALEGWQRIIDLGFHPQICSSPIRSNPHSGPEKLQWLARHFVPVFGRYVVEQAIITHEKHLFDGIALVDDRPTLPDERLAVWQHILFDRPYNQGGDKLRIHGWDDPVLGEQLQKAKELYEAS
jgi:5'-nucleotidase